VGIRGVWPARRDANQSNQRRQQFPKAGDRLFRETCVGDAYQCQDQNQAERQLLEPEADVPELVHSALQQTCRPLATVRSRVAHDLLLPECCLAISSISVLRRFFPLEALG
jgi:hypothetical protein